MLFLRFEGVADLLGAHFGITRGDTISGKNEVAMNHFVTLGFVVLLVALVVAVALHL